MAFETFAVHAACIRGVEAIHVTVEVSLAGGVPGIQMLGIPSMEVMESRGRIRCAMRSAGFEIPRSGITVNLAPGDIRKTGSGFDLPIAIGNEFVKMIFVSFLNSNIYPLKNLPTSRVCIFLETPYSKASSHFPIASHLQ